MRALDMIVAKCRAAQVGTVQELPLPLGDLVGVDVEPLSDHDEGLLAFDGLQGHLGLEHR